MKKLSAVVAAVALLSSSRLAGQNNWTSFGQDAGGTKFSTLTQINAKNVKGLKRAWTFHTGDKSGFFESTPLVIDGVLYFSAPNGVYALDAATGQQMWKYETTSTTRRGLTYWPGSDGLAPRLFSTNTDGLAALDPKTGALIPSFGEKGVIPGRATVVARFDLQEHPDDAGRPGHWSRRGTPSPASCGGR